MNLLFNECGRALSHRSAARSYSKMAAGRSHFYCKQHELLHQPLVLARHQGVSSCSIQCLLFRLFSYSIVAIYLTLNSPNCKHIALTIQDVTQLTTLKNTRTEKPRLAVGMSSPLGSTVSKYEQTDSYYPLLYSSSNVKVTTI